MLSRVRLCFFAVPISGAVKLVKTMGSPVVFFSTGNVIFVSLWWWCSIGHNCCCRIGENYSPTCPAFAGNVGVAWISVNCEFLCKSVFASGIRFVRAGSYGGPLPLILIFTSTPICGSSGMFQCFLCLQSRKHCKVSLVQDMVLSENRSKKGISPNPVDGHHFCHWDPWFQDVPINHGLGEIFSPEIS